MTRLGVAAALVAGEVVAGDVELAGDRVVAVGLDPSRGRGVGLAVPGIVDWQVNGIDGVHLGDADEAGYRRAGEALAAAGVVWAAPTFLSTDPAGYLEALARLGELRAAGRAGGFLRAHLEGPFLSESWRGAHRPGTFLDGDVELARRLVATGAVAMVTLAPERRGVAEVVRVLRDAGVVVAVGHSDATAQELGHHDVGVLTHCWNAHRRFAPRDPGPAGWALSSPGVVLGLVADGHHVAPETLALTFAAAQGRVALTTDSVAVADGIEVVDGAARLPDGTLAGSVATPSDMVRVLEAAGVPMPSALEALSRPQANALGLGEWRLRPGDPAHVTVFGEDRAVVQTWRGGERLAA